MNNLHFKQTADGSSTLYNSLVDEHYHSIHGALNESIHVFINKGFLDFVDLFKPVKNLNILEIGFGTGLNCILTFKESLKLNIFLNYTSLEPYPLEMKIIDNLNFNLDSKQLDVFKLIHQSFWGKAVEINKQFSLEKYKLELKDFNTNKFYDIIYFDAFAPNKQPELWKVDVFSKLFNLTSNNGVLVTYCAKGQVRRDLEKVGYFVERLEGPPGKREMLRATKV
ncbi:MAG: tRNA (5-methylaminomethyl-2-thiouridine)(34)-methyltransferase MnmD [Flavobacteriales bacterium]|nr:tRNA (5-methylaminomethyl-2-thiouridine)(34)-methyltransferase MnmD [Flavobacteriales bacterium]